MCISSILEWSRWLSNTSKHWCVRWTVSHGFLLENGCGLVWFCVCISVNSVFCLTYFVFVSKYIARIICLYYYIQIAFQTSFGVICCCSVLDNCWSYKGRQLHANDSMLTVNNHGRNSCDFLLLCIFKNNKINDHLTSLTQASNWWSSTHKTSYFVLLS